MAHGIGGNMIAMTIGGTAVNFKLTGWNSRSTIDVIDDTCPGDTAHSRFGTFHDWEVEFTGYIPDQAARHVFAVGEATLGTEIAFACKEKSGDVNPIFGGTGLAMALEIDASDKDRPISCRGRFQSSTGLIATFWDTTPGS